jgi:uncharacterized membrane protein YbhN (UPF0104 family)
MTDFVSRAEDAPPPRKGIPGWLRVLVPVVLLALAWQFADGPDALARLGRADWTLLALAFLVVNLQTLLSAWRWQRVAAALGIRLGLGRAVKEYYLAQLANQTLPGGVVGDAARAVRTRSSAGLGRAAQAVMIERMAGQLALFAVLAAGLVAAGLTPGGMALPAAPSPILLAAIAGTIGLAALALWRWGGRVGFLASFPQAISAALLAPRLLPGHIALSLAIVAANLASFSLCALATGTVLGIEGILILVPLILCAMLVPATIAGWGFREGAAAALFPLVAASAGAGLAASIAFGLVILVASLPGAFFLFTGRKNLSGSATKPTAAR